jgi:3-deoxy-manno-octulosonate cytidylyltransferase (CMP-KDO synthetase)
MIKALGIIPARWGSTRFPGKPLHPIAGKSLLRRVWERCRLARKLDSVIIATDDMRIAEAAFDWGAEVALTSSRHLTGTDRAAEVAARAKEFQLVVNIQGDEPLIDPRLIDRLVMALRRSPCMLMVTAAHPFGDPTEANSPHQVKVVVDPSGRALYFSRAAIPYAIREGRVASAAGRLGVSTKQQIIGQRPMPPGKRSLFLRHQGIYGFRRELLLQFVRWKPTPLEQAESLEQLRALENGVTVHVLVTTHSSPGVDTPQDAKNVERMLGARRAKAGNRRRA